MNNAITPAIGSNQFVTKFGARKRKFKVRVSKKVKFGITVLILVSFYLNYYLLKTNYVVTCKAKIGEVTQNWKLGHLMSVNTCSDLVNDKLANLTPKTNE